MEEILKLHEDLIKAQFDSYWSKVTYVQTPSTKEIAYEAFLVGVQKGMDNAKMINEL